MSEHPSCSIAARPVLTAGLLRCACGESPFAVAPGHDAMIGLEQPQITMLFDDRPDQPAIGFCAACWHARYGTHLAEAAA